LRAEGNENRAGHDRLHPREGDRQREVWSPARKWAADTGGPFSDCCRCPKGRDD
jgi:hypothetical protein